MLARLYVFVSVVWIVVAGGGTLMLMADEVASTRFGLAAVIGLLPPLALGVVGAGLRWVVRG